MVLGKPATDSTFKTPFFTTRISLSWILSLFHFLIFFCQNLFKVVLAHMLSVPIFFYGWAIFDFALHFLHIFKNCFWTFLHVFSAHFVCWFFRVKALSVLFFYRFVTVLVVVKRAGLPAKIDPLAPRILTFNQATTGAIGFSLPSLHNSIKDRILLKYLSNSYDDNFGYVLSRTESSSAVFYNMTTIIN